MTTLTQLADKINLNRAERTQYGLMIAWVLAMIALPIAKWIFGTDVIPFAVTFALLVQFSAVLTVLVNGWGWRAALIALGLVAVSTWGVEFVGSSTGFPFGAYEYTAMLQPQIGHVPLLIPLAWFMMLPAAWAVAEVTVGRHRPLAYIGMSAIAITAWDLFLDPQMVDWGFWLWENPVGYFGIPWSNYAGWLLTGVIVTVLVRPFRRGLPLKPLLIVYGVVWFLQSVGQAVFWGQPGPALVGGLVMGSLLVWAIWSYRNATP
jgi:lycopene beta-cyclase